MLSRALRVLTPGSLGRPMGRRSFRGPQGAAGTTEVPPAESTAPGGEKGCCPEGVRGIPAGNDLYLESILGKNHAWAERTMVEDPEFFEGLAAGQSPQYLWIGCSDARVPAAVIMDQKPGSVFVHRNVANLVVNTDVNLMSVIQYAVTVLDVKHIMVVGHYDCGGIKAAMQNTNHHSPLENWLRNIRDVKRLHHAELAELETFQQKFDRLVELNVVEQSLNVFKTWAVQEKRIETNKLMKQGKAEYTYPRVHGLVFHPADGKLKQLSVREALREHEEILKDTYNLYNGPLLPSSMAMPDPTDPRA
eukprot:TRINITY_DN14923_c0_g1_i1.p1 TRINITY_DN14923_c0_g1~~TRINITY_DN14923_c0_g1_i1.p1  ORF type:complete len:305 (-),score=63.24 TRINITY_DN14923_c0_g1_i1:68-982(-)